MTARSAPAGVPGLADRSLEQIRGKVMEGKRISADDALVLSRSNDLCALGALAEVARRRWNGNRAYYNINRHINYSNVCVAGCAFCAFSRKDGEEGAWTYSLEEIFAKAGEACPSGCTELHIVGGLHPQLPLAYYVEMLRGLRRRYPMLHLKAFTATEIHHIAALSGTSAREVIRQLKAAGLGSLPGGGGEVFNAELRRQVAGNKADAEQWLDVHRTAHEEGLKSTATMLYGHLESWEDRIAHMARLRELQDETGGFQAFVPLAFHPKNSRLSHLKGPSGLTDLKVMAISRLMLDNFPHLKAYWVMLGTKAAQVALAFGADDLDGTVVEETIVHMAGANSPQQMRVGQIERLIREAGREPVLRDSLYRTPHDPHS